MPVQHVSPLTIAAHKGDCYDYPENTMLAYKKAAEAGAHMLEVDVRITKDGELIMSPGGGSCQVSSTLYNTILQLPGITVLERHAHGVNGASYLPHGVDASSGDLNFRIRNDYSFPIRIEGSVHDFALFIAIYKEV